MEEVIMVVVSRQAAWSLDNSMFVLEGAWEVGYQYNHEVFFMVGLGAEDYCKVGARCELPIPEQEALVGLRVQPSTSFWGWVDELDYLLEEGLTPSREVINTINEYGYMIK